MGLTHKNRDSKQTTLWKYHVDVVGILGIDHMYKICIYIHIHITYYI
jgi:hypothetical protein